MTNFVSNIFLGLTYILDMTFNGDNNLTSQLSYGIFDFAKIIMDTLLILLQGFATAIVISLG